MKIRLIILLSLAMALITGACSRSKDQDTAKELLSNVPGDAAYAAVINVNSLVTSTGGKVKDATVIEPSKTLRKLIPAVSGDSVPSAHIDSIFAGKAGVEFSCFVVFENEGNLWLAAPLADPNKTKSYLGRNGYKLADVGEGLLAARDVVLDDDRIWVSLKDSVANASAVDSFKRLNSEQSMMASDYSDRLVSLESDYIDLWDSNILWRTLGPSADRARMISAFMFEDARYASFSADMSEKEIIAYGRFLNSEFKEAKCNLATSKLSSRDFAVLGEKAQAVAGVSLDSKLMKNIMKAVGAFGATLPKSTSEALSSIDGPLVMASDEDNNIIISISCKKGKEQAVVNAIDGLMMIFGNDPAMRMTTKEGSVLISFNGGPQSGTQTRKLGDQLDGAWLGIAFSAGYFPRIEPVKDLSVALVPAKSTVEFRIRIDY